MESAQVKFDGWPHIVKAQQFPREWLDTVLFPEAQRMREVFIQGGSNELAGRRMVTLFYQPSTRTRGSFQMAMSYLGGQGAFATENAREFSSAKKGESLPHTILNWNGYFHAPNAGVIVLRHYEEGAAEQASLISKVPIINAGDGPGQHPTQAFLDVFTLFEQFGKIDDLTVALVGDLANGRVARSLAYILSKYCNVKILLISSERSRMKDDIKAHLKKHGVYFWEGSDIREVASIIDAAYVIRDQKEYVKSGFLSAIRRRLAGKAARNGDKEYLIIDKDVMDLMRKDAIVMHPLPIDSKVQEIRPEIEDDPRVVCFKKQSPNGLFVRMALLKILLAPVA